jgi:uncharacterized protein
VLALRSTHQLHLAIPTVAGLWLLLAALFGIVIFVERRFAGHGPREIGLDPGRAPFDLLTGLAIGSALFCTVILELSALGDYRIASVNFSWALGAAALLLFASAALEELLMRGALFRLLSEWGGTWFALGLSALIFGLLHSFNPGATWVSTVAIALEAGILLAAAYVATGNVWLPIGLHFGWNFCEGPIFGTALSGGTTQHPLFTARITGAAFLTGGSFGPEAGLAAVVTCLGAAVIFLRYAWRRNLIAPCPWFRRRAADAGVPAVPLLPDV